MPANVVRSAAEERKWDKAKRIAAREGQTKNYAYITGIFKRMMPKRFKKEAMMSNIFSNFSEAEAAAFVSGLMDEMQKTASVELQTEDRQLAYLQGLMDELTVLEEDPELDLEKKAALTKIKGALGKFYKLLGGAPVAKATKTVSSTDAAALKALQQARQSGMTGMKVKGTKSVGYGFQQEAPKVRRKKIPGMVG